MIQIIFGETGSGKTKQLLERANASTKGANGSVVFINDDDSYMFDLNLSIRFINVSEFALSDPKMFYGFLCGIAASDHDLETVYVDGFAKLIRHKPETLKAFFAQLESFSDAHHIKLVISLSGAPNTIPNFLKKYIA